MCAATLQGLQLQLQLGPAAGIDGCCYCCATASTACHPTQTRHVQLPRSLLATHLGKSRSTVAWLASYRGIQCLQYTWLDESIVMPHSCAAALKSSSPRLLLPQRELSNGQQ
jgi:hypothetical protein